ncbi:MAG: DUF4294 domain-containing protein [Bacteroidetes bacterium]|nr:DUF4294 domain-containing protein [Bacteroidota bacterium]
MKRTIFFGLFALLLSFPVFSQDTVRHVKVPAKIIDGDTIPVIDLQTMVVFPNADKANQRQMKRYEKLVYNVIYVYPYAKIAGQKLKEYKKILDSIPDEKKRKIFIKQAEKELEAKFGDDIRGMTFYQGKILIKLIYRETGNSSFDIVKELRGGFSAFVYQTLARIFGYDLKTKYDPAGEDQSIENIIILIETGAI